MVLECDCGYLARGEDEKHLVEDVQAHAWHAHHMELTREAVLDLAHHAEGDKRPS
jgi:predicted small metal-binding protein